MLKFSFMPGDWRYYVKELLIVVIGILIAFALNNWAQKQSEKSLSRTYMNNLILDLAADTAKMSENIAVLKRNLTYCQAMIPHFFQPLSGRDTLIVDFFRRSYFPSFSSQDATYKTLLNTGDLKLIRSFDLKKEILDHYGKYDVLFRENERADHFARDYFANYMMNELDQGTFFQYQDDSPLEDPKFKNIVFSLNGILQIQINRYQEALDRTRLLLKRLEG